MQLAHDKAEVGHSLVDVAVIEYTLSLVQPQESVAVVLNVVMIQVNPAAGLLVRPFAHDADGFAVSVAEAVMFGHVLSALVGHVAAAAHELVAQKAVLGLRNLL